MTITNYYYTVHFCSRMYDDFKVETVCVSDDNQVVIDLVVAFNYFMTQIEKNMKIDISNYKEEYKLFKELDKKYEFSKSYNSYFVCGETAFVN